MAKAPKVVKEEPLETQLWKAADKLRKNIDAAEYKHVVLGLIFLKYISDAFEEHFAKLQAGVGEFAGADPEDKDEYQAENIFFVPAPDQPAQSGQPQGIAPTYVDIPGFCKSVSVERVAELDYVLTHGRYVGLPDEEDDFNFAERFAALKAEFEAQLVEEDQLNQAIAENLAKVQI